MQLREDMDAPLGGLAEWCGAASRTGEEGGGAGRRARFSESRRDGGGGSKMTAIPLMLCKISPSERM